MQHGHGVTKLPFVVVGPAPRATQRPKGPTRTLTFNATNLAGKPDTGGVVQVFSLDATIGGEQAAKFSAGVATLSVPAGHYFALASFGGLNSAKPLRTVVLPQVNVTKNTTVSVQETSADSKITMVTPRTAAVIDTDVWFRRTTAMGHSWTLEGYSTNPQQVWLSPTHAKTTVGTYQVSVNQRLNSPPGHGVPYGYTLSFTSPPGVVPVERHVLHTRDLATIDERFYQPVAAPGGFGFNGSFPGRNANTDSWFGFIEPGGFGVHLPGTAIQYAGGTGSARMEWNGRYGWIPGQRNTPQGGTSLLHAGEHLTDNWGAFPLHPGVNVLLTSLPNMFWLFGAILPSAVRAGNTLQLEVDPFDDNQPGNRIGQVAATGPTQTTGTYQVQQNGKTVASGDAVAAAQQTGEFYTTTALSPKPSTIRFSLNYDRTSSDFPLSTATSTVWTWHSVPVTGGQVPPGWSCVRLKYQPKGCAAEPMMTLRYAIAHLHLNGSAPAGPQALHLTVGHLQAATASKITSVAVSVSFDGGKTWHKATVTGAGSNYTASFTAPANTKVTLRTHATDAVGGSITESITHAYQIAS